MPASIDSAPRPAGPAVLRDRGVLSNGRYGVLLDGDGAGSSWFGRIALTSWSGGPPAGGAGIRFFVRDLDHGWTCLLGDRSGSEPPSRPRFHREPGRAVLSVRIGELEAICETCVPPQAGEDRGLELRRLRLRNHSPCARTLEVTTYGEVVLQPPAAHNSHPAFSRLFVRSEFVPSRRALLFRRRPRDSGDSFPCLVHALLTADEVRHETDRMRFLGRGRDALQPAALRPQAGLPGSTGDVLDPVFSLRTRVTIDPGEVSERTFLTGVAGDREAALALLDLESGDFAGAVEGFFVAAAREEEGRWRDLGLATARAYELERLAAAILCADPDVRPDRAAWRGLHGSEPDPPCLSLQPRKAYVVSGAPRAVVAAGRPPGSSKPPPTGGGPAAYLLPEAAPLAARFWTMLGLPIDVWVGDPDGGFRRL